MDELAMYLSTGRDLNVKDGLLWWFEHKHIYPSLYRMAIDYLSISGPFTYLFLMNLLTDICLATSVDVERTFSQGRLLLSHVQSCLSVQSTHALLCLGVWSLPMDYVKDDDVKSAAVLPELDGEEEELADDWDSLV